MTIVPKDNLYIFNMCNPCILNTWQNVHDVGMLIYIYIYTIWCEYSLSHDLKLKKKKSLLDEMNHLDSAQNALKWLSTVNAHVDKQKGKHVVKQIWNGDLMKRERKRERGSRSILEYER